MKKGTVRERDLGEVAYWSFVEANDGKGVDGCNAVVWENLTEKQREAWRYAAWKVSDLTLARGRR